MPKNNDPSRTAQIFEMKRTSVAPLSRGHTRISNPVLTTLAPIPESSSAIVRKDDDDEEEEVEDGEEDEGMFLFQMIEFAF